MNRLAITKYKSNLTELVTLCGLDEDRELVDFEIFEPSEDTLIGKIFVGRIENILKNINSAFIRILPNQICYLSLNDVKTPIYSNKRSKKNEMCVGDEVLVQVTKDAVKTKDPVVSTKLTFHGKYCILTTQNTSLSVSNKIPKEKAVLLKQILFSICDQHDEKGYGILLRTNSKDVRETELIEDIQNTILKFEKTISKASHTVAMSKVYDSPVGYIKKIKSYDINKFDYIYTDDKEIFSELNVELKDSVLHKKLKCYKDDKVTLATLYNLNGQIEKLLSSKIWLKSGANIIIEQLETLTVIDINTGKNITPKNNIILEVNKEAAKEIARQIRLRNISGMIIIDFINMNSSEKEQELISVLKQEIKKDSVKCSFIDITKLGLVELTRKKVHKSLKEILKNYVKRF